MTISEFIKEMHEHRKKFKALKNKFKGCNKILEVCEKYDIDLTINEDKTLLIIDLGFMKEELK